MSVEQRKSNKVTEKDKSTSLIDSNNNTVSNQYKEKNVDQNDKTNQLVAALQSGSAQDVRRIFRDLLTLAPRLITSHEHCINFRWHDEKGNTLLHLAASLPDAECLNALFEGVTNLETYIASINNNKLDKDKNKSIEEDTVAMEKNDDIIEQESNNYMGKDRVSSSSPSPSSSSSSSSSSTLLLLPWRVNRQQETPLHVAARCAASPASLLLLISHYGVDMSTSIHGDTFLHLLMSNTTFKRGMLIILMQELLSNVSVQEGINVVNGDGNTMLDIASHTQSTHLSLILLLSEHNAQTALQLQYSSRLDMCNSEEISRKEIYNAELEEYHQLVSTELREREHRNSNKEKMLQKVTQSFVPKTRTLYTTENVDNHTSELKHVKADEAIRQDRKLVIRTVEEVRQESAARLIQRWWRSKLIRLHYIKQRHSVGVISRFWRAQRGLQWHTQLIATKIITHALIKWCFARERWTFIVDGVKAEHMSKIAGITRSVTNLVWRENFINSIDSVILRNRRLHALDVNGLSTLYSWWHRWQSWCASVEWITTIVLFLISAVELIYMAALPRTDANKIHNYADMLLIILELLLVCVLPLSAHHCIDFCVVLTALVCSATLKYGGTLLSTWFLLKLPYLVKCIAPHHTATYTFCMALDRTFFFLCTLAPLAIAGLWANIRGSAVESLLSTGDGNAGALFICFWNTLSPQYMAYIVENLVLEPSARSLLSIQNSLRALCLLNLRTAIEQINTIADYNVWVVRPSIIQLMLFELTLMVYSWASIMLGTVSAIRTHYDLSDAVILRDMHQREKELASTKDLVTATGAAMIARFETRNQPLLKVSETDTSSLLWERDIQAAREAIEASHYDHTTRYAVHLFVDRIMESVAQSKQGVPWELPYKKPQLSAQLANSTPESKPIGHASKEHYHHHRRHPTTSFSARHHHTWLVGGKVKKAITKEVHIKNNVNDSGNEGRYGNPLSPLHHTEDVTGTVEAPSNESSMKIKKQEKEEQQQVNTMKNVKSGEQVEECESTDKIRINPLCAKSRTSAEHVTVMNDKADTHVNERENVKEGKKTGDEILSSSSTAAQALSDMTRRWDCRNEDYRLRSKIDMDVMEAALSMTPRLRWFERFMLRQWTSSVFERESNLVLLVMIIMCAIEPNLYAMEAAFSTVFTIELIASFVIFPISFFSQHYVCFCIRIFCILVGFIPNANPYVVLRAIRLFESFKWRSFLPDLMRWSALYWVYMSLVLWFIASVASVQNWKAVELDFKFRPSETSIETKFSAVSSSSINSTTKLITNHFSSFMHVDSMSFSNNDRSNNIYISSISDTSAYFTPEWNNVSDINVTVSSTDYISSHSICSDSVANCFAITLREMVLPCWTPQHIDPRREAPLMSLIVIVFQLFVIPFILSFVFHPLKRLANTSERFLRLVISTIHDELLEYVHNYVEGEEWYVRWSLKTTLPISIIVKLKMWVYDSHRINVPDAKIVNSSRHLSMSDYVSFYRFQRKSSFVDPFSFTTDNSNATNMYNSNHSKGKNVTTVKNKNKYIYDNNNNNYNNSNNLERSDEIIRKAEFASFAENEQWDHLESGRKGWPRLMAFKRTPLLHYINLCLTLTSLAFLWVVDSSYTRADAIVIVASIFHLLSIISALLVMPADATCILTIISCTCLFASCVFMLLPLSVNYRYYYSIRFISVCRIAQLEVGPLCNLQKLFRVLLKLTVIVYFPLLIVGLLVCVIYLLTSQIYLITHRLPDCLSSPTSTSSEISNVKAVSDTMKSENTLIVSNESKIMMFADDTCAGSANWTYAEQLASHPWRHASRPNTDDTRHLLAYFFYLDSRILYSIYTTWMLPAFCITTVMAYQCYNGVIQQATEYFVVRNIELMDDPMTLSRFPLPRKSLRWVSNVMLLLSLIYGCIISPSTDFLPYSHDLNLFFGLEVGFTLVGCFTSIVAVLYAMHRCARTGVSCKEWPNDYLFVELRRSEWILLCGEVITLLYYCIAFVLSVMLLRDKWECIIAPIQYSFYFITLRFVLLLRCLPRQYLLYFIRHCKTFFYTAVILVAYFVSASSAVADLVITLYVYERELTYGESKHITPRLWRNAGAMLLRATFTSVIPDSFELSLPWFNSSELFIQNTNEFIFNTSNTNIESYVSLDANDITLVFLKTYSSTKLIFTLSVIGKFFIAVTLGILISVFALPLQTCLVYPLPTHASLMYEVLRHGVRGILTYGARHQEDMRMSSRQKLQQRKFVNAFTSRGIPSWALPHVLEELNICKPSRQRRFMFLLRSLLEYLPISERRQKMVEEYVDMWDCYSAGGPASVWFSELPTYPISSPTTKAKRATTVSANANVNANEVTSQMKPEENTTKQQRRSGWQFTKTTVNNTLRETNKLAKSFSKWCLAVASWFEQNIHDKHLQHTEHNKIYISPIRLVQALAIIELDFPANSSVSTKLWLDFFLVTQRLRAAVLLQSLWRMYKDEKVFEETHTFCESIRIAILRRQFRKYRVNNDVVFRTYNSFTLATEVEPNLFNPTTDHFYLLSKLRSRYASLVPVDHLNLVNKLPAARRNVEMADTSDNLRIKGINNASLTDNIANDNEKYSNPLKR